MYKKNLSFKRIYSHLRFGRKIYNCIKEIKPGLIYVMLPPNNAAFWCCQYKKKNPNCKYITDITDLWPESMPLGRMKRSVPALIWTLLRTESVKMADYIFLECSMYKKILRKELDQKKTSILYLFKNQTVEENKYIEELQKKKKHNSLLMDRHVTLGYVGSINHIVDTDGICNIIKTLMKKGFIVEVHIIGDGENKEKFLCDIAATGCYFKYYGSIYDTKRKADILCRCDFGLNMMLPSVSVGLTIKSLDYFALGLPVINNIKGDTWEMVEKYRIGINWKNEDAVEELVSLNLAAMRKTVKELYLKKFTETAFIENASAVLDIF